MDSKASEIIESYEKLLRDISSPDIYQDYQKASSINLELEKNKKKYKLAKEYLRIKQELEEAKNLSLTSTTTEDKDLYNNIITSSSSLLINIQTSLQRELTKRSVSSSPSIIEIRAGSGGEESALFVQDLLRMYSNFCKKSGWQTELVSATESSLGGLKEVIFTVNNNASYPLLQYESGVHRVQRVPTTEASGRIHTSAASVVVYPQLHETQVDIDPSQLEILTYRSSGPGGQSVNTTDSAVRVTHKPTGLSVTCQDSKSQLKNKEKAITILKSKIHDMQLQDTRKDVSDKRRSSIKSGDRSDKIRTYNFPQNRITDHRINTTWHGIENIMNGDIEQILSDLQSNQEILE